MKNSFRFASVLMALGLLGLASGTASATSISFNFENKGVMGVDGSCGSGCYVLESAGIATETSGLAGFNQWLFEGVMKFFPGQHGNTGDGTDTGSGYGWSFTDLGGNNDLYGTFTSSTDGILVGSGSIFYTVLGGSGLFAGATGSGTSTINYLLGLFDEHGSMDISSGSTSVPEPAMGTLLIAGLGLVAFMAYRRRRAMTRL